jgi:hypothetical protein
VASVGRMRYGGQNRTTPAPTRAAGFLALGLACTLALSGCDTAREIFPKAFPSESAAPSEPAPSVRAEPTAEDRWETATTDAGDMSFRIRDDWKVEPIEATAGTSTVGITGYRVLAADGRELAVLQQHPGRATIQALPGAKFTPIDSVPAPDASMLVDNTKAAVSFDFTAHPNAKNRAVYGLTSGVPVKARNAPGRVPLGAGVQGYPKLAGPLMFQGMLEFDTSIDDAPQQEQALAVARDYVFSQEYADIVEMIRSLRHHPDRAVAVECESPTFNYAAVNIDCDTVVDVYHTARIVERFDERRGNRVRVEDDYWCTLKELGAKLDGLPPGYGIDGECRYDGGYGTFTATWKE